MRTVVFDVMGRTQHVDVKDVAGDDEFDGPMADAADAMQIGAPMPGVVDKVYAARRPGREGGRRALRHLRDEDGGQGQAPPGCRPLRRLPNRRGRAPRWSRAAARRDACGTRALERRTDGAPFPPRPRRHPRRRSPSAVRTASDPATAGGDQHGRTASRPRASLGDVRRRSLRCRHEGAGDRAVAAAPTARRKRPGEPTSELRDRASAPPATRQQVDAGRTGATGAYARPAPAAARARPSRTSAPWPRAAAAARRHGLRVASVATAGIVAASSPAVDGRHARRRRPLSAGSPPQPAGSFRTTCRHPRAAAAAATRPAAALGGIMMGLKAGRRRRRASAQALAGALARQPRRPRRQLLDGAPSAPSATLGRRRARARACSAAARKPRPASRATQPRARRAAQRARAAAAARGDLGGTVGARVRLRARRARLCASARRGEVGAPARRRRAQPREEGANARCAATEATASQHASGSATVCTRGNSRRARAPVDEPAARAAWRARGGASKRRHASSSGCASAGDAVLGQLKMTTRRAPAPTERRARPVACRRRVRLVDAAPCRRPCAVDRDLVSMATKAMVTTLKTCLTGRSSQHMALATANLSHAEQTARPPSTCSRADGGRPLARAADGSRQGRRSAARAALLRVSVGARASHDSARSARKRRQPTRSPTRDDRRGRPSRCAQLRRGRSPANRRRAGWPLPAAPEIARESASPARRRSSSAGRAACWQAKRDEHGPRAASPRLHVGHAVRRSTRSRRGRRSYGDRARAALGDCPSAARRARPANLGGWPPQPCIRPDRGGAKAAALIGTVGAQAHRRHRRASSDAGGDCAAGCRRRRGRGGGDGDAGGRAARVMPRRDAGRPRGGDAGGGDAADGGDWRRTARPAPGRRWPVSGMPGAAAPAATPGGGRARERARAHHARGGHFDGTDRAAPRLARGARCVAATG